MLGKSTHLHVIPQQSTQTQTCGYKHPTKTSRLFYNTTRASTLALAIVLKIWAPLQKFPIPVKIYNSLDY